MQTTVGAGAGCGPVHRGSGLRYKEQCARYPHQDGHPTAAPGGTQTVGDTGDGTVREDGSYVPGQVDRLRLTYNGNVSSALYVTSAAQLPDYPGCPPTTMRSSRTMRWCWCRSR